MIADRLRLQMRFGALKQIYNARSSNIIQKTIYRYNMRTIYAVM